MMKEDFENLIVTRLIEGKKKTTHSMLNEIEWMDGGTCLGRNIRKTNFIYELQVTGRCGKL